MNKKRMMVVVLEVSILAGIGLAYLAKPRNFPLSTFLLIGAAFVVLADIILLNTFNKKPVEKETNVYRSKKAYTALALFALFWLLIWLWHL